MANELRVTRANFVNGLVGDNPLTITAITLTSAALASLPVVDSAHYLYLVIDPDSTVGAPEIVKVTAHTVSAITATIVRQQQGTAARAHNLNEPWVFGPIAEDFDGDTAWHAVGAGGEPAFQNSWANYGSGFAVAAFRKDGRGIVHLKGLVKTGLVNTVIFTLPAGYRPAETNMFSANGSASAGADLDKRIDIASDGTVKLANTASAEYLSLSGIRFFAEA